ncbi:MAG: glycoside hydrolase family 2 TIM barrel-domain containing protein [Thomasclavelia ramosa]
MVKIVFRGVNRHEFAAMSQAITKGYAIHIKFIMHNINAVRTSHYQSIIVV